MAEPKQFAVTGADRAFKASPFTNPAHLIGPGEKWLVNGLDWAWAFVVYAEIRDYPDYCIGSNGTVWSKRWVRKFGERHKNWIPAWQRKKPKVTKWGHRYCVLFRDGGNPKGESNPVHHLVLEPFIGPCPPGLEGCHWDGDPSNNNLYNVRWDTSQANSDDAIRHSVYGDGRKRANSRLKLEQVAQIRRIWSEKNGNSLADLSRLFGVDRRTIKLIITGETWNFQEAGPIPECQDLGNRKLSDGDIPAIFKLAMDGLSHRQIAERFGVMRGTIRRVLKREIWCHVPLPDGITIDAIREITRRKVKIVLTEDDIPTIFDLRLRGVPSREIAKRYGVSKHTINAVLARRAWKHVVLG